MLRYAVQLGCMLLVLSALGCEGLFGPQGLPPDPLFTNRKPIESKARTGSPEATPFTDPVPPINPYFVEQRAFPSPLLRTSGPGRNPAR